MPRRGSSVQRRVLTVGPVDAEVEISQEYLAQSVSAFPLWGPSVQSNLGSVQDADRYGDLERTKELLSPELEIFVGHGNTMKMGGLEAEEFAKMLEPKLKKEKAYSLLFFACDVGKPVESKSYAAKVAEFLNGNGYRVAITAPKQLVFVLGSNLYAEGSPFTKELEKSVDAEKKKLYYNALVDTINTLVEELTENPAMALWDAKSRDEAIESDIVELKARAVKAAKNQKPKTKSLKEHFIDIVESVQTQDKDRTAIALATRIEQIMGLKTYKTLVRGLSAREVNRLLEARYFRNIYYPVVVENLKNKPARTGLLETLPGPSSGNWETI